MLRLRPGWPSSWDLLGALKSTYQKRDESGQGPEWSPLTEEVRCSTIVSIASISLKRIKNSVSGILLAPISFLDEKARKAKVGWEAGNTPRRPTFQPLVPSLAPYQRGKKDGGSRGRAIDLWSKPAFGFSFSTLIPVHCHLAI